MVTLDLTNFGTNLTVADISQALQDQGLSYWDVQCVVLA